jgi:hypothetical protein
LETATDSGVKITSKFTDMPLGYIVDTLKQEPEKVLFSRFSFDDGEVVQTLYKLSVAQLMASKFDELEPLSKHQMI